MDEFRECMEAFDTDYLGEYVRVNFLRDQGDQRILSDGAQSFANDAGVPSSLKNEHLQQSERENLRAPLSYMGIQIPVHWGENLPEEGSHETPEIPNGAPSTEATTNGSGVHQAAISRYSITETPTSTTRNFDAIVEALDTTSDYEKEKPRPRFVVVLDFGTTFAGFAYARMEEDPPIYVHYELPSRHNERNYCKTLTGLYYARAGPGRLECASWGYHARSEYMDHRSSQSDSQGHYLTKFKLLLKPASMKSDPMQAAVIPPRIRLPKWSKKIWLGTYDTAKDEPRAFIIRNLICMTSLKKLNQESSDGACCLLAEGEKETHRLRNEMLMSRLAPFFKQHIKDALEPILEPVASLLQSHGEAQRKQQEKMVAFEKKKLTVRREKIRLKGRRGGRCQRRRRAAFAKPDSSRLRIRQGDSTEVSSDTMEMFFSKLHASYK